MSKKILIIEDDNVKIERLTAFFNNDEIQIKESFQAGLLELKEKLVNYDFLILDMTIPIWENGNNDLGGNYEQFGGERILREMRRRKLFLPTILFTMFDVFPTKEGNFTFQELNNMFKAEYGTFYKGAVFYNADDDNWQIEMSKLIDEINE